MGDYASWLRTERQALLTLYGFPTCEANTLTKENWRKIEAGAKSLYAVITVDEYFKRPIITRLRNILVKDGHITSNKRNRKRTLPEADENDEVLDSFGI
jgi:hypothetical protein